MSNENFTIGASNYDARSGGFERRKYFYIEANTANYYRVLPPVLSMVQTGRFFQFHAVHRNMRAADGKQRVFKCTEDQDFKTKMIKVRCAVCDKRREYEMQYENAKTAPNVTKEQLSEFFATFIDPLQSDRKYYMNVVNQAGEIGVLSAPATIKNDLFDTCKRMTKEQGVDPTSSNGIFFNFIKTSQYKGDKKPVYKVEPVLEQTINNGIPSMSYKFHQLTPDFIEKMKKSCADLNDLHRTISQEDMVRLISATPADRANILSELYKGAEKNEDAGEGPGMAITSAATPGVSYVPQISAGVGGFDMRANTPVTNPLPTAGLPTPNALPQATQPTAPVANPLPLANLGAAPAVTNPLAPSTPASPGAPKTGGLSNEEFMKTFGSGAFGAGKTS